MNKYELKEDMVGGRTNGYVVVKNGYSGPWFATLEKAQARLAYVVAAETVRRFANKPDLSDAEAHELLELMEAR